MRFLIFFLFILFSTSGITQTTYPSNQWFGSANTLTEFRGAATTVHGFVNAVYSDTATANLAPGYLRFYPGAQIMAGDSMYFRNLTATAWLLMNGSGGGGGPTPTLQQVITAGATLTGNNSIAGGGFNFGITNSHVSLDAPGGNYISLEDGGGDMVFSGQAGEIRLTTTGTANDIHVTVGSATFEIFGKTQSDDIFMRAGKRLELGAGASDLATPVNGQMYYNSVSNKFRAYENGAWTNMIGGGGTWGSITGTLSNQTDLQNALDLKAPLISPLFTTPRLNSTSTTGYVWTATDASGNGSFQAIPADNLTVQRAGSGIPIWYTSGDTLYLEDIEGSTFIDVTKTSDSTILVALSATGTPSSSTYLRGDNTWATIAGGGDVTKVGTPINNQLGVWTGDGTIEGDANLTFASSTLNIGVAGAATGLLTVSGVTSGTITIQPASAAGTYTLTLPTTDGNSGEFLQTNGSGVLTWAAGGAGSYTFSTGLTDAASTITANLSTGVSGGQSVIGGTGSGDDLTLSSTTDVTKGYVIMGSTIYDEVNNRLGIKGTPSASLDVLDGGVTTIQIGADVAASTRTNSTLKAGGIVGYNYTNAEEPISILRYISNVSANDIHMGIGTTGINTATGLNFHTGAYNSITSFRKLLITTALFHINDPQLNFDFRYDGDNSQNVLFGDASADAVGILTNAPTAKLDINSDILRLRTAKTPASAAAAGNAGDICWDADYIYVCIATNTWRRVAHATW